MKPNFAALWGLLDRALDNWVKRREVAWKKKELKQRADEIVRRHTEALNQGALSKLDREELAAIMKIRDPEMRLTLLAEFDKKTRARTGGS